MILSLEIGATNTRIGLVEGKKVSNRKTVNTPKNKIEILNSIHSLISSYSKYDCICVAIAGVVKNGKIIKTPNINFSGVNIKEILKNKYSVPIYIDNDAYCAALAELEYGIDKKEDDFFLLTLGTGIGGALVKNRKITPIEIGHIKINGREFEDIASGTATLKLSKKYGFSKKTNEQIYALAKKNNLLALKLYNEVGNNLSLGLKIICNRYKPKTIVFSGGFSKINYIINATLAAFRAENYSKKQVKFVKTSLGDNIGLIGATLQKKLKNTY